MKQISRNESMRWAIALVLIQSNANDRRSNLLARGFSIPPELSNTAFKRTHNRISRRSSPSILFVVEDPQPLFDVEGGAGSDTDSVPSDNDEDWMKVPQSFFNDEEEGDEGEMWSGDVETLENVPQLEYKNPSPIDEFIRDEDDILTEREDRLYQDETKSEKCILVGVEDLGKGRRSRVQTTVGDPNSKEEEVYFTLDESLNEMRELIKTAGLDLTCEITQRLNEPNPRTYIGTGKVKETLDLVDQYDACTVVFDAELTPGQQKALENTFNRDALQNDFMVSDRAIKVVDRTALILDIFAQHAKTREGKLQVDLALHEYRKPRLTKMWTHLERQSGAGGVGLRGPGESQLEIDKRLIRDRIIVLKRKIDDVQKQRGLHREGRTKKMGLPILSLVGYTNSGKSTMLNFLTRAGVMAENILFATLDPTTRKVKLPGYKTHPEVLLTDTVGFIQKLPTQLVAAFRATLEEVQEADVLIHIIDISNPMWQKQEDSVIKVLKDIGATQPIVRVFNKIDLLDPDVAEDLRLEAMVEGSTVAVSSLTGDGMVDFVSVVEEALSDLLVPIEVVIPYSNGEDLNKIHEVGNVETIDYRDTGTYVAGRVPRSIAMRLKSYFVNEMYDENSDSNSQDKSGEEEIDWTAIGRGRHPKKKATDLTDTFL